MQEPKCINWNDIYTKESGKLLSICRRYVGDIQIAEDILHDSFIKAIQNASAFKNEGAFEGWLKQIVINSCLDYIRINKKQDFVDIEEVQIEDEKLENATPSNIKELIYNASFSQQDLLEAIDSLPTNYKTIFNLHVIDGKSHKEICDILNISLVLSKTTLHRSRKKLQDFLTAKAANTETDKKKRKKAAILLPSLGLASYANAMDMMFKNAFANTQISASSASIALQQGLQQASPVIVKSSIGLMKLGVITAGTIGTAAILTVGIIKHSSTQEKDSSSSKIENKISTKRIITVSKNDSTKSAIESESQIAVKESPKTENSKSVTETVSEQTNTNKELATNTNTQINDTNKVIANDANPTPIIKKKQVVMKKQVIIQN